MDAMLEAICEAKLHGSSALSNAYARRRRRLRLRYLSASAKATRDALADVSRRVRRGLPVADEEIEGVLYAISVSLEAAGRL
jgi:hypothetical protein